ncbi:MAG: type I methionyl aminopeptidase [Baekduia sp.]
MIVKKSPRELEKMAAAGAVHTEVMQALGAMIAPGITTREIDAAAERMVRERGGIPTFKGYPGPSHPRPFPGSICASPDSMVVHGIPDDAPLADGQILSVDLGVTLDGWVADAAVTFPIGTVTPVAGKLLEATRASLMAAVPACAAGGRLGDVSSAVQTVVEAAGFSVVRSLVGHGVGRDMHEDPQIPNFGAAGKGPRLEPGMVFAVEPMTTVGHPDVYEGDDHWAIYSKDGSLAAHFEFTIAVTDDGPRILTPWHEGDNAL